MDLERVRLSALEAAQEAGRLLLKMYGSGEFRTKADGSLQTAGDLYAEELLQDRLSRILPGVGFLSEEGRGSPSAEGFLWVCDPLDGTTNFVNHQPAWGVSIALLEDMRPVVGVVHLPIFGETLSAVRGRGAFSGDKRLQVRESEGLAFADVYTFCSLRSNEISSSLPGNVRAYGSTIYDVAQLVQGRTVGGWELGAKLWDAAAGLVLLQEAGGVAFSLEGADLSGTLVVEGNLRDQPFPFIFACSPSVYALMREDMGRS